MEKMNRFTITDEPFARGYLESLSESKYIRTGEKRLLGEIMVYIVVMAVCMFANSWCKTKAAVYLTSAELYPLYQGRKPACGQGRQSQ